MAIDGSKGGRIMGGKREKSGSSVWEVDTGLFQAGELHKGCVLQIAAEDGVTDIDDNGLGRLGIHNTRHMNV